MIDKFDINNLKLTKYIFFTGKGGVGKTSISCAVAVSLADAGNSVLLVSTDPASNLQDVFDKPINEQETIIKDCPNLKVINVDPMQAAADYRNKVIQPYIGLFPEDVINNMQEQLSGSCTIEIAAFNEFSRLITDAKIQDSYDYIIFDTAPTGHTLRILELPSAWTNFINENPNGASCLGQLSGLGEKRAMYQAAVNTLTNPELTTMVLVTRPQKTPVLETERSSIELSEFGIKNQMLIINGLILSTGDDISSKMMKMQKEVLDKLPISLRSLNTYSIPLKSFNITGLEKVRQFFKLEDEVFDFSKEEGLVYNTIDTLIDNLYQNNKKVIFTMGKGGVGKTTIASLIANGLAEKGLKVHLTTTDPANHLKYVACETDNLTVSHIDEKQELRKYQSEVITKARKTLSKEDVAYIEEDLRSPCTQEIAVFRAFAEVVEKAEHEIVVIDTAPTGHTLLLLDSTQSYSKEISRSNGEIPQSVYKLLPRLRNEKETEVVIVTLAEPTPVLEAQRLQADLKRAGILNKWWIINQSLYITDVQDKMLVAKANSEKEWIDKVKEISNNQFIIIPWHDIERL